METSALFSRLYRDEWGYILARLIRLLGDFGAAEEIAQEAFAAALEQWPIDGVPDEPRGWILKTAQNKAIDWVRRRRVYEHRLEELARSSTWQADAMAEPGAIGDDRLRLIFTCCHPALALEAQVALTLRTLCGLRTEEIARAFLVPVATMAQRLVRAQSKIKAAGIPYRVPDAIELPERLEAVMAVVYLVFNEGYSASGGDALVRSELCREAVRLARLLMQLLAPPIARELYGLLALLLLQDSRRETRVGAEGELVLLEDQDRSRWDVAQIAEALPFVEKALGPEPGSYALQAAIAALHARAARPEETDWCQIAVLYELLLRVHPSPIVSLNHAVAVAMAEGPEKGLALIESLAASGTLDDYHWLHAARADLLRRLGRHADAIASYRRALAHAGNAAERRFLERRLAELSPI